MSGGLRIEAFGFSELEAAIAAVPEETPRRVHQAVEHTARAMKDDMRARAGQIAGRHAAAYPRSITYDIADRGESVHSEVGPDKELPQGPLANVLEGGSPTSDPHPHVTPAYEANVGDLEVGLGRVIEDVTW